MLSFRFTANGAKSLILLRLFITDHSRMETRFQFSGKSVDYNRTLEHFLLQSCPTFRSVEEKLNKIILGPSYFYIECLSNKNINIHIIN